MKSEELAKVYEDSDVIDSQEDGEYRFIYLGNVTARLKEAFLSNDETTTYVALAVERLDGMPLNETETFVASPLIQGLNPVEYNVYTMGGGATWKNINGICYMIMAVDSIEMFSDKSTYLAVTTGPDYALAYQYDEETGLINKNEIFVGINALFNMKMDSTKADVAAQNEYLANFGSVDNFDVTTGNYSDFGFGSEELDYILNYNYEAIDTPDVEKIMMIEDALCIDSYEFEPFNDYYHVSFENEYGSGDGEMSVELFEDNRVYLELWVAGNNEVILEYNRRDTSDTLHVSHYLYKKEALSLLIEKLKTIN